MAPISVTEDVEGRDVPMLSLAPMLSRALSPTPLPPSLTCANSLTIGEMPAVLFLARARTHARAFSLDDSQDVSALEHYSDIITIMRPAMRRQPSRVRC